jgi:hypothetical protein
VRTFQDLLDMLCSLSGEDGWQLGVARSWEQRVIEASLNFDELNVHRPEQLDSAFRDRKRIRKVVEACEALLASGLLDKSTMATWILNALEKPTEREVRNGLFELTVATHLHRIVRERLQFVDLPARGKKPKRTDLAIRDWSPVEVKALTGGLPSLRDRLRGANAQHKATRALDHSRCGITFVALPFEDIEEAAAGAYFDLLCRELCLVFDELTDTGAVYIVMDEFKQLRSDAGKEEYDVSLSWAVFLPRGGALGDPVPSELLQLADKPGRCDCAEYKRLEGIEP